jgi:hypothetical protein
MEISHIRNLSIPEHPLLHLPTGPRPIPDYQLPTMAILSFLTSTFLGLFLTSPVTTTPSSALLTQRTLNTTLSNRPQRDPQLRLPQLINPSCQNTRATSYYNQTINVNGVLAGYRAELTNDQSALSVSLLDTSQPGNQT